MVGNIARGEAESYITTKAKCQVLFFSVQHELGDDLNDLWNFLAVACSHTLVWRYPPLCIK